MTESPKTGSEFKTALYVALGALLLLLLGLGVAAYFGGSGDPVMVYEGFN